MRPGAHTWQEIQSQPETWQAALQAYQEQRDAPLRRLRAASAGTAQVIVLGCGSTYYLALTAARLLRQSGCDASAYPSSEWLLYRDGIALPGRDQLLLTLSRSGETTETLRAQQAFRAAGGSALTITCDSGSSLAQSADHVLAIDAAQERSVAQTRSFSSMALVVQLLAAELAGQDTSAGAALPAACRALLAQQGAAMRALAEDAALSRFFFLGAGPLYGIACEAMLKLKEMSLSSSEAYHPLEFRHGPMSMAGAPALLIGLLSPPAAQPELRLLQEMTGLGARSLSIGQLGQGAQQHIALDMTLPAWACTILHLPPLQLLAYYRARMKGYNPDQPQQLSAVIVLDDV